MAHSGWQRMASDITLDVSARPDGPPMPYIDPMALTRHCDARRSSTDFQPDPGFPSLDPTASSSALYLSMPCPAPPITIVKERRMSQDAKTVAELAMSTADNTIFDLSPLQTTEIVSPVSDDTISKQSIPDANLLRCERPGAEYFCPERSCRRRFRRRGHVKRHMIVHSGKKLFVCWVPECNKKFSRKDNLKAHGRTHSSPDGTNRYVATLDPDSRHSDPSFRGRLTASGTPIHETQVSTLTSRHPDENHMDGLSLSWKEYF